MIDSSDLLEMINREVSLDPSETVELDTDLLLSGLVDSLGLLTIVGWLEDRLGRGIDPGDITLDNFQSVRRMIEFSERTSS